MHDNSLAPIGSLGSRARAVASPVAGAPVRAGDGLERQLEERTLGGYCPYCAREVPPRNRAAASATCGHCGGRYV